MKTSSFYIRRIAVSAIFLSISLVIKTMFSFYIPMFGENGVRIGVSGIFSMMPALLFGPLYGAIVSGLVDFLGYILKPMGAYLPLMTLAAALGGLIRGALWRVLQKKSSRKMRIVVIVCSLILLLVGIGNVLCLSADGINSSFYAQGVQQDIQTDQMHLISRMLITRTMNTKDPAGNLATYSTFVTTGVIGSAVLGLLLLIADFLISRKSRNGLRSIPQLLLVLILSGLIVTTLNTVILRETIYASWKVLPFSVIWIPRVAEEILGNTVKAYFIAVLLGVVNGNRSLRTLVGMPSVDGGGNVK
ncbi:MAG: ECF transporter S component [Eubacteriales bacterium]|nr:ECF transporter S component [Eubacteriales bacterium]